MKITYLQHSGVIAECGDYVLIFDYYRGELPVFSERKHICVFVSHWHQDHFQKQIFEWRELYPEITYILSDDVRVKNTEKIWFVSPEQSYEIGGLKIKTLRSTDEGVAFFVWVPGEGNEGCRIYHAGDLNWWHWEEESDGYNQEMKRNYQNALKPIEGERIDAAFVPVDPRLGDAYYWGLLYFLEHTDTKRAFPIHMWGKYEVCERLIRQPEMNHFKDTVMMIKEEPQIITF